MAPEAGVPSCEPSPSSPLTTPSYANALPAAQGARNTTNERSRQETRRESVRAHSRQLTQRDRQTRLTSSTNALPVAHLTSNNLNASASALKAAASHKKKKLGMFKGVLVPTCENMWGVIIFLRFYTIVGYAGLGVTIIIVTVPTATRPHPPPHRPSQPPSPFLFLSYGHMDARARCVSVRCVVRVCAGLLQRGTAHCARPLRHCHLRHLPQLVGGLPDAGARARQGDCDRDGEGAPQQMARAWLLPPSPSHPSARPADRPSQRALPAQPAATTHATRRLDGSRSRGHWLTGAHVLSRDRVPRCARVPRRL